MTAQPIHPVATARQISYSQLLAERTRTGRRLMDAFCHGLLDSPASAPLWSALARLDTALAASPRYPQDFIDCVVESEQDRWHGPGTMPTDQTIDPCVWCQLQQTSRTAIVVPDSSFWSA